MSNKVSSASFLDVLLALKKNTMRDTNVAEVVRVVSFENDLYKCEILTNPTEVIFSTALMSIDVRPGDIALAVFTKSDFRVNLNKVKNGQQIQKSETSTLHSKNYGVLVGVIYRQ